MKTVINIRTDKETKEKAQRLAEDLGVTLSTVINVYLRQFIRTKEFTFSLAHQMSPELEAVIAEVEKDIVTGKNISPAFDNAEDAIAWLEKPESERTYS
ncbi:MAG: type II toxin-antitoxin system RelB/DinJ family antitoxin [bacterium]|nr:type II toxin-antitoxin system RelB/DinJ family antitoxin [bacterium]